MNLQDLAGQFDEYSRWILKSVEGASNPNSGHYPSTKCQQKDNPNNPGYNPEPELRLYCQKENQVFEKRRPIPKETNPNANFIYFELPIKELRK